MKTLSETRALEVARRRLRTIRLNLSVKSGIRRKDVWVIPIFSDRVGSACGEMCVGPDGQVLQFPGKDRILKVIKVQSEIEQASD